MSVLYINHMPLDDPYGATGALRRTITSILEVDPDHQFEVAAPSGDQTFGFRHRNLEFRPKMVMNYVGGLPHLQAFAWNATTRLANRRDLHLGLFDDYFDLVRSVDIVHVNSMSMSWLPAFSRRRLGHRAPPFICHIREIARPATYRALASDFTSVSGAICIDSSTRNAFRAANAQHAQLRVWTIGDLVDGCDNPKTELSVSLREWASGAPVVGMAGRIDPVKGMAFVSSLMQEDDDPQWKLVIAGRATRSRLRWDSRAEFRHILRASKRFPNRVRYLGEIPSLSGSGFYRGIDLLVRADQIPGLGLTVYEALAMGVPVLLPGRHGDFQGDDPLFGGASGVNFANPRDASAYRSALLQILSHPSGFVADPQQFARRRREHALAILDAQRKVCHDTVGN